MNFTEKIKTALDSKKVTEITDFEMRDNLRTILKDVQENIGLNPNEVKAEIMADKITNYIRYYKYLTICDIENIFEAGSIGLWGETYRLNMQVVHKWFSEYCKERTEIMQKIDRSDSCTTEERLQFLYKNRDKLPYFKSLIDKPRVKRSRTGLKQIKEI